ncbi:MAG: hypothetical protein OWQ54_09580 [Sulfolobaceae archaeon]|nr:hypothetical protein [Sulfolobaceae archaeon]
MDKPLLIKIFSLADTHLVYLALHALFILIGSVLSAYVIYVKKDSMGMTTLFALSLYFVLFFTYLLIVLSLSYRFEISEDKLRIYNLLFPFTKSEIRLYDKDMIIGFGEGKISGNLLLLENERLLYKFVVRKSSMKRIRLTLFNKGYRVGGVYKVCKVCGGINDLEDVKCNICGSRDLITSELLWRD